MFAFLRIIAHLIYLGETQLLVFKYQFGDTFSTNIVSHWNVMAIGKIIVYLPQISKHYSFSFSINHRFTNHNMFIISQILCR